MAPQPDPTREGASAEATNENTAETVEGGESESQPTPQETRPGLESIVANRRKALEDELNEGRPEGAERVTIEGGDPPADPDVDDGPDKDQDPPPANEGDTTPPPAEGEENKTPPAAASEPMVQVTLEDGTKVSVPASRISTTVKLDGEEVTVDGRALATGYQKDKVSTARFRAANEALEEARRLREAAPAPQQSQPTSQPDPKKPEASPAPSQEDLENDPDFVELAETLQFGEPKDAAKKLAQIMAKRQPAAPTIDEAQIVQRAVMLAEQNRTFQDDLNAVATSKYRKIFQDDFLWQNAAANVHRIRAENLTELGIDVSNLNPQQLQVRYEAEQAKGTVPSRREVFFAAAQRTADWVKQMGGTIEVEDGQDVQTQQQQTQQQPPNQPGNPGTFQRKAEEKRGMQTPPTPSAGARNQPPPAKPAQSGSDIVAEMRRARGQAY